MLYVNYISIKLGEKETAKLYSRIAVPFYIPTSNGWVISFSISLLAFDVVTIFYFNQSNRCVVMLTKFSNRKCSEAMESVDYCSNKIQVSLSRVSFTLYLFLAAHTSNQTLRLTGLSQHI